jgi:hypothetical protein
VKNTPPQKTTEKARHWAEEEMALAVQSLMVLGSSSHLDAVLKANWNG